MANVPERNAIDVNAEKIQDVLGRPVLEDFTEETRLVRRNLLFVASIALAYELGHLSIGSEINLIGISIKDIPPSWFERCLFLLVSYQFIHFFWNSSTHLQYTRVRLTGTRLAYVTTGKFGSDLGDYPDDPRHSSLYRWWQERGRRFFGIRDDFSKIVTSSSQISQLIEQTMGRYQASSDGRIILEISEVRSVLTGFRHTLSDFEKKADALLESLGSKRMEESLRRFDRWFFMYQWNQILKWTMLDWFFPLALGIWAIALLTPSWWR
jgi:hypothetical protein